MEPFGEPYAWDISSVGNYTNYERKRRGKSQFEESGRRRTGVRFGAVIADRVLYNFRNEIALQKP
jgi:hypothetical protein